MTPQESNADNIKLLKECLEVLKEAKVSEFSRVNLKDLRSRIESSLKNQGVSK